MDRHHNTGHQCLTTSNTNAPQDCVEYYTCYKKKNRGRGASRGNRALSVVAPKYWNELPDDIWNIELQWDIVKKKLKNHYFKIACC